jgi:hypothetical protein
MTIIGRGPGGHIMVGHEIWLARRAMSRGQAAHGTKRWRMQQNYGPEGMALLAAAYANFIPGWLVGNTGLTALAFFQDSFCPPSDSWN